MREIYSSVDTVTKCADLHTHGVFSDGKMNLDEITEVARELGICAVGVTDHNFLLPGILGKGYAQVYSPETELIPGEEISTSGGHVLGLYLKSDIPQGKDIDWTLEAIHDQDGLAIAVHPFAVLVKGIGETGIQLVINSKNPYVYFDGFEVYNAGLEFSPRFNGNNDQALAYYSANLSSYGDKLGGAVGSSDAHFYTLGGGRTWYNNDLRDALTKRETKVTVGYPNGRFEGLNTAHTVIGPRAFDRYTQLSKRAKK